MEEDLGIDNEEDDEFQNDDDCEEEPPKVPRKFGKKDKPPKRFICTVTSCSYTTPYKKDLVRHMRKHTGEKPYNCELCSKQFSRYDKLLLHTRAHEQREEGREGLFHCKLEPCSYSSNDMSALKRHVAHIHSDEKPFACQLCSYRAKDSNQLNIHIRFHTGDSPYACAVCPSAFKTATDLRRHNRIHTKEKPYACPNCPFTTAIKCNLTVHVKRKHPRPPEEVRPFHPKRAILEKAKREAKFPFQLSCKFCNYKTGTIKSFKLHMVKQHKTKNYDAILNEFGKKPTKQRMIREPNPAGRQFVTRFKCPEGECTQSFVSEKSLRCHVKQHVTLHPPPAPTIEVIITSSEPIDPSALYP